MKKWLFTSVLAPSITGPHRKVTAIRLEWKRIMYYYRESDKYCPQMDQLNLAVDETCLELAKKKCHVMNQN